MVHYTVGGGGFEVKHLTSCLGRVTEAIKADLSGKCYRATGDGGGGQGAGGGVGFGMGARRRWLGLWMVLGC